MFRTLAVGLTTGALVLSATPSFAEPGDTVVLYGVQPATGQILRIDGGTGDVVGSFAAPAGLEADHTLIGLTTLPGDTQLAYENSQEVDDIQVIDIATGEVIETATGDETTTDGLSAQSDGTSSYLYYSDPEIDLHRQTGLGGPTEFFWETGAPIGGIGGDGHGRNFGYFDDGSLHEFDPFVDDGSFDSTLPAPAGDIQGVAFADNTLFVSTDSGTLFTLDPDTGAVLRSAEVEGGGLYGLAATNSAGPAPVVPEGKPVGLLMVATAAGLVVVLRQRRLAQS